MKVHGFVEGGIIQSCSRMILSTFSKFDFHIFVVLQCIIVRQCKIQNVALIFVIGQNNGKEGLL